MVPPPHPQHEKNGSPYQGYEGDTVASALLANGINVVGRSFKYSRPRGIMTAGIDEPNAILQLGKKGETQTPNVRATEQPLFEGLACTSVKGWPNVDNDVMSLVGKAGGSVMGPGFYYKTFMFPSSFWLTYEAVIRKAAGLGRSPKEPDSETYDHMNHHTDVMVVGAGPAGLCAALAAAKTGVDVLLVDNHAKAGGEITARASAQLVDGVPATGWVDTIVAELNRLPNVKVLLNTLVNGCHDHNFLTAVESRQDHLAPKHRTDKVRQRMHKIRAGELVLATGAHERPLVFANNDVPGCLTAGAVVTYIKQYAVAPGKVLVLGTNNDSGYEAALAWHEAGLAVAAIADARQNVSSDAHQAAVDAGIKVITGSVVTEVIGGKRVKGAVIAKTNADCTEVDVELDDIECDTVATSGGYSPVVHLSCHTGTRPVWDEEAIGFVPGKSHEARHYCGSVTGRHELSACLASGVAAGQEAAKSWHTVNKLQPASNDSLAIPSTTDPKGTPTQALYLAPHSQKPSRAPKQFVDMQNDVTAAAIHMATQEGFENIEHVKRYTALGFGTDQGKTGNINGLAIAANNLNKTIEQTGTTTFRPNYAPVSFGAVTGANVGPLFDPKRFTAMQPSHVERAAEFEDVGQWKRPWYFPVGDETMDEAVRRECQATRTSVGILDASTLGKIDIQGPDAREFLGRVYTNAWEKLAPGRCRYGLMCGEDGMVMDDGVTACLADNHFHMTTTTGGAANVLNWLEIYHQTDWPELDVFFTSVTVEKYWQNFAVISIFQPMRLSLWIGSLAPWPMYLRGCSVFRLPAN